MDELECEVPKSMCAHQPIFSEAISTCMMALLREAVSVRYVEGLEENIRRSLL